MSIFLLDQMYFLQSLKKCFVVSGTLHVKHRGVSDIPNLCKWLFSPVWPSLSLVNVVSTLLFLTLAHGQD